MLQRSIEKAHWQVDYRWKNSDEISKNFKRAAIAAEDQRFKEHWGFDFIAIEKAYKHNKKGKKIKGGSTITQQTAKNVFLWAGRSWVRKGLEAYFTVLLELFWSKSRILEVYLNVIEMGDGIYGVEAASQRYFNTSANHITKAQAAYIIAVLPAPLKWSPIHPSKYIKHKQSVILRLMRKIR